MDSMERGQVKLAEQFHKFPWVGSYVDCVEAGQLGELAEIDAELRCWLLDMTSMGHAIMDADEQLALVYQLVHRAHMRARVALETATVGASVGAADCAYRNAVHVAEVTLAYVYDFHACVQQGYVQEYLDELQFALSDADDLASVDSPNVVEPVIQEGLLPGHFCDKDGGVMTAGAEVVVHQVDEVKRIDCPLEVSVADVVHGASSSLVTVNHVDKVATSALDGLAAGSYLAKPVPVVAVVPAMPMDDEAVYPFAVLNLVTVIGSSVKLAGARVVLHHNGWGLLDGADGLSDNALKLMHAVTMVEAVNSVVSGPVWIRPGTLEGEELLNARYINTMAGTYGVLRFEVSYHPFDSTVPDGGRLSSVLAGAPNVFTSFPAHVDGAYRDKCGVRVTYFDPPTFVRDAWLGDKLIASHDVIRYAGGRQGFDESISLSTDSWSMIPDLSGGYDDEKYADGLVAWELMVHAAGGGHGCGELVRIADSSLLGRQMSSNRGWSTYEDALRLVEIVQMDISAMNAYVWSGKPGYCYLELVKSRHKQMVASMLGAWPTVEDLLSLSHDYFDLDVVASQALLFRVRFGVFHIERVDLLPDVYTNGRLLAIWSDSDLLEICAHDSESFAAWLYRARIAYIREGVSVAAPDVSVVAMCAHIGGDTSVDDVGFECLLQALKKDLPFFEMVLFVELLYVICRWCSTAVDSGGRPISVKHEAAVYLLLVAIQVYGWVWASGRDSMC